MKKISISEIETLLGIYPPFKVHDVDIDVSAQLIAIKLFHDGLYRKGLAKLTDRMNSLTWNHVKVGSYRSTIELEYNGVLFDDFNRPDLPSFLGRPHEQYTKQLEKSVEFGLSQGLSEDVIANIYGTTITITENISQNLKTKGKRYGDFVIAPPTSAIWSDLIKGAKDLSSSFVPLVDTINKLRNEYKESRENPATLGITSDRLYNFFKDNKNSLKDEFKIVGFPTSKAIHKQDKHPFTKSPASKALSIDHPIWDQLLDGSMNIPSTDVSFTLILTKLISRFKVGNSDDQMLIKKELMYYLKVNASLLTKELDLILKAVKHLDAPSHNVDLPESDSPIWKSIIDRKIILNSTSTPLNLFVAKLRFSKVTNPGGELKNFIVRTAATLESEIKYINEISGDK
jgi:hypothetical protein